MSRETNRRPDWLPIGYDQEKRSGVTPLDRHQLDTGIPGFRGRNRLAHLGQCSLQHSVGSCSTNSQASKVSNFKNSTTKGQPLRSGDGGSTIRVAERLTNENNLSFGIRTTNGVDTRTLRLPSEIAYRAPYKTSRRPISPYQLTTPKARLTSSQYRKCRALN